MIMSVEELKKFITTTETDEMLAARLLAIEQMIRGYTNNNFQRTGYRRTADIVGGLFIVEALTPFEVGDTVQIGDSELNAGLYTVAEVTDSTFRVNEDVADEKNVLVTKVSYPADVKMGVVNMVKWDLENRAKVGIQSETISRHSVTYFDLSGDNAKMGYPKSLLGFLKPYRKARF